MNYKKVSQRIADQLCTGKPSDREVAKACRWFERAAKNGKFNSIISAINRIIGELGLDRMDGLDTRYFMKPSIMKTIGWLNDVHGK